MLGRGHAVEVGKCLSVLILGDCAALFSLKLFKYSLNGVLVFDMALHFVVVAIVLHKRMSGIYAQEREGKFP